MSLADFLDLLRDNDGTANYHQLFGLELLLQSIPAPAFFTVSALAIYASLKR